jgi:hypothetical protein
MSAPVHRDALPEHPDPDLAAYRPVSGWGIAALVVGLASAAALAHPLLWCVPLLGLGLSIVALRRIERSQVKVLGRSAALAGLAFSLIYGIAAPARLLSHEHWLAARAERLSDELLDLLRAQQRDAAFALTRQSAERQQPRHPTPPGEKPEAEPPNVRETFLSGNPVARLLTLGPDARIEHLRTDVLPREDVRQTVTVLYEVHAPEEHGLEPLRVLIYADQVFDGDGNERWWISSVGTPPPPRLSP